MFTGSIKWFSYDKGYGFISQDNSPDDIFVHISDLEKAGIRDIREGQKVSFQVAPNSNRGKNSAVDIKLI